MTLNKEIYTKEYIKNANMDEIISILKSFKLSYSQYKDFLFDRELLESMVLQLIEEHGQVVDTNEIYTDDLESAIALEKNDSTYYDQQYDNVIVKNEENKAKGDVIIMDENLVEKNSILKEDIFIYISNGSMILKSNKGINVVSSIITISNFKNEDEFELDLLNTNNSLSDRSYYINNIDKIFCSKTDVVEIEEDNLVINKEIFITKFMDKVKSLLFNITNYSDKSLIIVFNETDMIKVPLNYDKELGIIKSMEFINLDLLSVIGLNIYNNNLEEGEINKNLLVLDINKTLILKSKAQFKEGEFCYIATGEGTTISKNLNISLETLVLLIIKYGYYKALNLKLKTEYISFETQEEMFRTLDDLKANLVKDLFVDDVTNLKENMNEYYFNMNSVIEFLQDLKIKSLKLKYNAKNENKEVILTACEINRLLNSILYNALKDDLNEIEKNLTIVAPIRIVKVLRDVAKEFIPGKFITGFSDEKLMNLIEYGYKNVCEGVVDHNFTFHQKDVEMSLTTIGFKGNEIEILNNEIKENVIFKSSKTSKLDFVLKLGGIIKELTFYLDNFSDLSDSIKSDLNKEFNSDIINELENSNKIYLSLNKTNDKLTLFSIQNKDGLQYVSNIISKDV